MKHKRKKTITKLAKGNYNYSECPLMSHNGRGCNALTEMICRSNPSIPCGFYPEEAERRKGIKAK